MDGTQFKCVFFKQRHFLVVHKAGPTNPQHTQAIYTCSIIAAAKKKLIQSKSYRVEKIQLHPKVTRKNVKIHFILHCFKENSIIILKYILIGWQKRR